MINSQEKALRCNVDMLWSSSRLRILGCVHRVVGRIVHCVRCMADLGRTSNWAHGRIDQIVRIGRVGLCGPHVEDLRVV